MALSGKQRLIRDISFLFKKRNFMKFMLVLIMIGVIILMLAKTSTQDFLDNIVMKYFNREYLTSIKDGKKEGFTSSQCPTTMIKQDGRYWLYNPKLAQVPGVNPVVVDSLTDYESYLNWQRANGLKCPILHVDESVNLDEGMLLEKGELPKQRLDVALDTEKFVMGNPEYDSLTMSPRRILEDGLQTEDRLSHVKPYDPSDIRIF